MAIVILIGGGHAAGKSTAAKLLKSHFSNYSVHTIDLNTYNKEPTPTPSHSANAAITVNSFAPQDLRPSRFDFAKLKQDLQPYLASPDNLEIIIIHGLYALYDKELRDLSKMKVFITSDPDTRLIRWIRRDVIERKTMSLGQVVNTYLQGAKQEMSNFIFPTKEFADVIMPRGAEVNAVKLVVDGILPLLAVKDVDKPYLRPIGLFQKERFDDQKGNFYELT